MPIFGGSSRPRLDGLTKDEEKRRDSLNPEVMRRAGEGGVAGQAPAALAVLKERSDAEPDEFLWAVLLGWQLMSMRRFAGAIDAFIDAVKRDGSDVRGYYGAGIAYFEAGQAKQELGPATPPDAAPEGLTIDNLFHEALRYFRTGLDQTTDKDERNKLTEGVSATERALARKAGRL